jgi:hypothetical protein
LNNILEQDHRAIKRRVNAKQGFALEGNSSRFARVQHRPSHPAVIEPPETPDLARKILKYALEVAEEKPENSRFIIPVKFEDVAIPFKLQDWVPVNQYEQSGWDRLLSALNSHPARTL